jgi:hypothetical protein
MALTAAIAQNALTVSRMWLNLAWHCYDQRLRRAAAARGGTEG